MTQCAKTTVGFAANVGNVFIKHLQTFSYFFPRFYVFLIYIWTFITAMEYNMGIRTRTPCIQPNLAAATEVCVSSPAAAALAFNIVDSSVCRSADSSCARADDQQKLTTTTWNKLQKMRGRFANPRGGTNPNSHRVTDNVRVEGFSDDRWSWLTFVGVLLLSEKIGR